MIEHTALAANPAWSTSALDQARQTGDPAVDGLAAEIIAGTQGAGQQGYLRLMDLANRLLEAPELSLVQGSQVRQELDALPAGLRTYFDPQEVPDWVDADALAIASRVWDENKLVIIGVLYAASLPACYLIAKGIPALYDSGKLLEKRFIDQRIYETGLMLEAVMEPAGISIVQDAGAAGTPAGRRYMWGRGVIAARKVRMLHAAMRQLLEHPAPAAPEGAPMRLTVAAPYAVAQLGRPVNQEDLAYTLLTFGYLIPRGLERWGCQLSEREKEAFLHTWRLVAHLMGVAADLVPRSWREADVLFALIQGRQKAGSEMGKSLTDTLNGFLAAYLPPWLRPTLPAMLIVSQLGPADAQLILPHGLPQPGPLMRTGFALGLAGLRAYFFITDRLVSAIPVLGKLLDATFRQAGEALVDSWRDDYQRLPFALPISAAAPWQSQAGVGPELRERLQRWRNRLFSIMVAGIACMVAATLLGGLLAAGVLLRATGLLDGLAWNPLPCLLAIIALYLAGATILQLYVAREVRQRPGPPPPALEAGSTRGAVRRLRRQR